MTELPPAVRPRSRWWRGPNFWLAVLVVGFFAVSSWAGFAAYSNFQFANNTDAGIITQAVASTTYGRHPVFFESYDCMVKYRCSFLLVHPGLVLYGAVPFFALWPSTITLFLLRSALVALSAVPLYWLTRRVTGSSAKALLAAGVFLVWAPSFLGDAFSLHLETILPLELFSLAALWQSERYRLGLAVAAVSFVTIEVAPIFTFLLGLFFLAPLLGKAARRPWPHRGRAPKDSTTGSWWSRAVETLRQGLRRVDVQYTLVLMVVSLGAYVVLYTFMNLWGSSALGVLAPPVGSGVTGVFSNNSSPAAASISTILASPQTIDTAEFWLVLYATLAFIPLLSPRSLILSVPWIGWTFLTNSSRFTTIGHQYTMVAAGPLFIGLAYGLSWVPPRPATRSEATAPDAPARVAASPEPTPSPTRQARHRGVRAMVVGLFAAVIVANVLFVPVNPLLPDLGVNPGIPFEPDYFDHTLAWNPSIESAEAMVGTIPDSATVAAPSSFFPLVAAYPHAVVLVQPSRFNTTNLPFNVSSGPDFVLITPSTFTILSSSYRTNVSDPSVYGMRGWVGDANLGPLLLYEKGYAFPAQRFGPALPSVNTTWAAGNGLVPGVIGELAPNATSPASEAIFSLPGTNRTGRVATTPSVFLPPGTYTLQVVAAASPIPGASPPHRTVLEVLAEGFGATLVEDSLNLSAFGGGNWTSLSWNVTLADPVPNLTVDVNLLSTRASIAVALVRLVPSLAPA